MTLPFRSGRIIVAVLFAMTQAACASLPGKSTITLGNQTAEFAAHFGGAPTVVFESGLGEDMNSWGPVLSETKAFASTFAYNRPGRGQSRPKFTDPGTVNYARHLHDLLERVAAPKPWVLVGHSLGGLYSLTFAKLYPTEVQAVVLVDSTPPGYTRMLRDQMPAVYGLVKSMTSVMPGNASREFRASQNAGEEYEALGPFPPIPVILLRRTRWSPLEGFALRHRVVEMQKAMIRETPCPFEREVASAGHFIQRDRPAAVVKAIRQAVRETGCSPGLSSNQPTPPSLKVREQR